MIKICTSCNLLLPLTYFGKDRRGKFGVKSECHTCKRISSKKYRQNNKEKVKAYSKKYREENKEECNKRTRDWERRNKGKKNATWARYRARKLNATPKWLSDFDKDYIKGIYMQASHLGLEVDHIIPLQGKNVCGLHVPWNLQLLTKSENCSKGNKYEAVSGQIPGQDIEQISEENK